DFTQGAILPLVIMPASETKVFSGNSKEQQGEAQVTLPASPMGQKPVKHFPPDGDSSPSNDGQSSIFSELQERRHPYFLTPRIPLSWSLCPLQAACASLQENGTAQIEKEFPKDYTCCDLVVKLKECRKPEDRVATPEPSPATPSPTVAEGPQSSDPLEDSSGPRHLLASSMTLQEALEVRRPQFISRSQKRLQKLKHMVQQRKAQQKENPGQKQSLLPVRAHKKQFTVPHPLSDNLFKPKERCISEKEMHMRSKRYLAVMGEPFGLLHPFCLLFRVSCSEGEGEVLQMPLLCEDPTPTPAPAVSPHPVFCLFRIYNNLPEVKKKKKNKRKE
ncbi:hypothetical protein STEG23_037836, partial [Scotinomys teguina]